MLGIHNSPKNPITKNVIVGVTLDVFIHVLDLPPVLFITPEIMDIEV